MGIVHFWDKIGQDELTIEAKLDPQGRAMAELIRRYEPLAIKVARSMTACRTTQDDLAKEARMAAAKKASARAEKKAEKAADEKNDAK